MNEVADKYVDFSHCEVIFNNIMSNVDTSVVHYKYFSGLFI